MSHTTRLWIVMAAAVGASIVACRAEQPTAVDGESIAALIAAGGAAGTGHQKQCDTVTIFIPTQPLPVGGVMQLGWAVYDKHAKEIDKATVAWSSSDPGVAAVTSSGVVTGVSAGTADIVATCTPFSGFGLATVIVQ